MLYRSLLLLVSILVFSHGIQINPDCIIQADSGMFMPVCSEVFLDGNSSVLLQLQKIEEEAVHLLMEEENLDIEVINLDWAVSSKERNILRFKAPGNGDYKLNIRLSDDEISFSNVILPEKVYSLRRISNKSSSQPLYICNRYHEVECKRGCVSKKLPCNLPRMQEKNWIMNRRLEINVFLLSFHDDSVFIEFTFNNMTIEVLHGTTPVKPKINNAAERIFVSREGWSTIMVSVISFDLVFTDENDNILLVSSWSHAKYPTYEQTLVKVRGRYFTIDCSFKESKFLLLDWSSSFATFPPLLQGSMQFSHLNIFSKNDIDYVIFNNYQDVLDKYFVCKRSIDSELLDVRTTYNKELCVLQKNTKFKLKLSMLKLISRLTKSTLPVTSGFYLSYFSKRIPYLSTNLSTRSFLDQEIFIEILPAEEFIRPITATSKWKPTAIAFIVIALILFLIAIYLVYKYANLKVDETRDEDKPEYIRKVSLQRLRSSGGYDNDIKELPIEEKQPTKLNNLIQSKIAESMSTGNLVSSDMSDSAKISMLNLVKQMQLEDTEYDGIADIGEQGCADRPSNSYK